MYWLYDDLPPPEHDYGSSTGYPNELEGAKLTFHLLLWNIRWIRDQYPDIPTIS